MLNEKALELDDSVLESVTGGTDIPAGCFIYYIKPGDCLSVLAQRYHTTVRALQSLNNITNPNVISDRTTLFIPYQSPED